MKNLFAGTSLFVIICLILSTSCQNSGKSVGASNNLAFDTVSIVDVYHLDNDSTKPSCSLKINYITPSVYSDTAVLAKIQSELNNVAFESNDYEHISPADAAKKYTADYIESYKSDVKRMFADWQESGETEDYFSYYKTIDSEVLYDLSGILSYQVKSMDYKGGANSYTEYRNVVFDLKTGERLHEKDIFVAEYKKILDPLLLQKLYDQNKVNTVEELYEIGYSRIEDFTSNDNFWINEKGITYIFSQGDYSTPSIGEIKVFFAYGEIKHILKDESPISIFF